MAQSGYTPIQLYYSTTAAAVPVNTNLANGELAINITDGKLYYKNNSGVVTLLAGATAGPAGGSNTQVQFNSSGVLAGSAGFTWNNSLNILTISGGIDSVIGATNPLAGAFTTINASGAVTLGGASTLTLSGGTANGVTYLNGSKVLTSGSALTFDGTNFATTGGIILDNAKYYYGKNAAGSTVRLLGINAGNVNYIGAIDSGPTDVIFGAASTLTNQAWYVGGSEQMRLNSTGLGIGTSSPAYKLDVSTNTEVVGRFARSSGTDALLLIQDPTTTTPPYVASYGNAMAFGTYGGTEFARFTSTGLGIGTSSPAFKLQVIGTTQLQTNGAGTQQVLQLNNDNATAGTQAVKLGFSSSGVTKASINAAVYGNDYMTFNVGSDTERMRIDASGNVGIGTSSPGYKLDVVGTGTQTVRIQTNSSGNPTLLLTAAGANSGYLQYSRSAQAIQLSADASNVFYSADYTGLHQWYKAGATETMRLDSSGNLGLGVTPSAGLATANYRLFEIGLDGGGSIYSGTNQTLIGTNIAWSGGTANYKTTGRAPTLYNQQNGAHSWSYASTGTAGTAITFTQAMTLDASGNLGIGTTSPSRRLSVYSTSSIPVDIESSGNDNALRLLTVGGSGQICGIQNSSGNLLLQSSGAERARIDSSGNLLVGTTSANGTLTVSRSGSGNKAFFTNVTDADFAINLSSGVALLSPTTGILAFGTSSTERARIDSSGNLIVGGTSNNYGGKLTVDGDIIARGNRVIGITGTGVAAGTFAFRNSTGTQKSAIGSYYNIADEGNIEFLNGTSTNAVLTSAGNLLVGTTSFAYNPTQGATIAGGSIGAIGIGHASGTATGNGYANFAYNGTNIGSITQSGTTAVLYNVTSDQRLKENIVDAPEFGSVIDSIKVRSYDWKADGNHQRAGFIAQELVTVAPEAVHQPADSEEMMAVDYSKLVPMLVKEVQSLRKRLADAGL